MSKFYCLILFLFTGRILSAQPSTYTSFNGHSHNDYEQSIPLLNAYTHKLGSIEADIILYHDTLFVAHDIKDIHPDRTLESLYLNPLYKKFIINKGKSFQGTNSSLQLLIDIKTEAYQTLKVLIERLELYKNMVDVSNNPFAVKIVISGNRPKPEDFTKYPSYIFFDGRLSETYSTQALTKVALISDSFANYSSWNGKGKMVDKDEKATQGFIQSVHKMGKASRFWGAPDTKTTWLALMDLGSDYIGTDKPDQLETFLSSLTKSTYKASASHSLYKAKYLNDDKASKVKNVILIIGDGFGLAQMQASLVANGGNLNLLQVKNIGLSRTSSSDNFNTDSAAGATAMASGNKTKNRYIGMSSEGIAVPNIIDEVERWKMKTGIISTADLTDATPACFYAHNLDRENYEKIALDLINSPLDFVAGDGIKYFNEKRSDHKSIIPALESKGFQILNSPELPSVKHGKVLLFSNPEELNFKAGDNKSGRFLLQTTNKALELLPNPNGFFLMIEAAQVDWGGHSNNMAHLTEEALALDQLVGKVMEFADNNGETLVIITADHETGGLSLLEGDPKERKIHGTFSTTDHTGIMVPIYAYGPHSMDFKGIYENNEIFHKIIQILKKP